MKLISKSIYFDENRYKIIADEHVSTIKEITLEQRVFLYLVNKRIKTKEQLIVELSDILGKDLSEYKYLSDLLMFDCENDSLLIDFLWESFYEDMFEFTFDKFCYKPIEKLEIIFEEKGTSKYQGVTFEKDSKLSNDILEVLSIYIESTIDEDVFLVLMNRLS